MPTRAMSDAELAAVLDQGWLSRQPAAFRAEVLARCLVQDFDAGKALYHLGDPGGGIYGLVRGLFAVTAAPGASLPRMFHIGLPGVWTGEGPYMTGEPRRLTLAAASDCRVLHLPLDAMERMTAADPAAARRFAQIPMMNIDTLLRVISDLLIRDPDRRLAAVLLRVGGDAPVPLSQAGVAELACVTRKQVNFALKRFAAAGWVTRGYRSIAVTDLPALRRFVAADDDG